MNVWSNLPNAKLIDRVLADLRARPLVWNTAQGAVRGAVRGAARDAALDADRGAALDAAWNAARDAALDAAWNAARGAAWRACMALIAWDDAALMLDMPIDAVRLLAAHGHHPAVLMLPACIALNGDSHERME